MGAVKARLVRLAGLLLVIAVSLPATGAEPPDPKRFVHSDSFSERTVVVIPDNWRTVPPFDQRFQAGVLTSGQHMIDLAAYRFATDGLVSGDRGDREFRTPDTSSFAPQLIVAPFRFQKADYFIVQAESPESQRQLSTEWLKYQHVY